MRENAVNAARQITFNVVNRNNFRDFGCCAFHFIKYLWSTFRCGVQKSHVINTIQRSQQIVNQILRHFVNFGEQERLVDSKVFQVFPNFLFLIPGHFHLDWLYRQLRHVFFLSMPNRRNAPLWRMMRELFDFGLRHTT